MKLLDCHSGIVSYTLYFLESPDKNNSDVDSFSKKLDELIDQSKQLAEEYGVKDKWKEGFFAICSLLDEKILSSDWVYSNNWAKHSLQMRFFGTTNAGEEFYDRLNHIDDKEVGEVYLFCLYAGFKGKYFHIEDEGKYEDLKYTYLKKIYGDKEFESGEILFPMAYQKEKNVPKKKPLNPPKLLFMLLVIFLILALVASYYFYSQRLNAALESVASIYEKPYTYTPITNEAVNTKTSKQEKVKTPPKKEANFNYFIQLGAYKYLENAKSDLKRFKELLPYSFIQKKGKFFRIFCYKTNNLADAKQKIREIYQKYKIKAVIYFNR